MGQFLKFEVSVTGRSIQPMQTDSRENFLLSYPWYAGKKVDHFVAQELAIF